MAQDFSDTETQLSPDEQIAFDKWAGKMRIEGKIHPLDDFSDYDMKGYWKETGGSEDIGYKDHFPDKWKRPNHPTFSTDSIYSQGQFAEKYGDMAGTWEDDAFLKPVSQEELSNIYENDRETETQKFDEIESLEKKFGVKLDYAPQGISDKKEEIANNKDMSPGFVDTMNDIAYSFFKGIHSFGVSLQELGAGAGAKVAELVAGEDIDFDPSRDMNDVGLNKIFMPEPTTTAGKVTEGLTQVGLGVAAGKMLRIPGIAKTQYGNALVNSLAKCFGYFTLETMSFSANEMNFAEILKVFKLPTIEALVKNPDDTYWQKKIKNGVGAAGAGIVIDGILSAAKMFYKAGKQAIRNKRVISVEGTWEYPMPSTEVRPDAGGPIIDAEYTSYHNFVEGVKGKPYIGPKIEVKQISGPKIQKGVK